ncbi:hypothetical protein AAC387_Pa11g1463 [Persea americana]
MSLASRCFSCFSSEETESHLYFSCFSSEETESPLFFSCNLAYQFWFWLLSIIGSVPPSHLSPSFIWEAIAYDGDANGRKCATAIFFHAISILWSLRNGSKYQGRKRSLQRAKFLFLNRLKGMAISQLVLIHPLPAHPILVQFGLVSYSFVMLCFSISMVYASCLVPLFRSSAFAFSHCIRG